MNKLQVSFYQMAIAIFAFRSNGANAAYLSTAFNDFATNVIEPKLANINDLNLQISAIKNSMAVTAQKKDRLLIASTNGAAIAAALVAFYNDAGNIKEATRFKEYNTPAKLRKGRFANAVVKLGAVQVGLNAATAVSLAAYGITNNVESDFNKAYDDLTKDLTAVRDGIAATRAANEHLAKIFLFLRADFKLLDSYARPLEVTNPSVWLLYQNARNLVLQPTSPTAASAMIADINGSPLQIVDGDVQIVRCGGSRTSGKAVVVEIVNAQMGDYKLRTSTTGDVDIYVFGLKVRTIKFTRGRLVPLDTVTVDTVASERSAMYELATVKANYAQQLVAAGKFDTEAAALVEVDRIITAITPPLGGVQLPNWTTLKRFSAYVAVNPVV